MIFEIYIPHFSERNSGGEIVFGKKLLSFSIDISGLRYVRMCC